MKIKQTSVERKPQWENFERCVMNLRELENEVRFLLDFRFFFCYESIVRRDFLVQYEMIEWTVVWWENLDLIFSLLLFDVEEILVKVFEKQSVFVELNSSKYNEFVQVTTNEDERVSFVEENPDEYFRFSKGMKLSLATSSDQISIDRINEQYVPMTVDHEVVVAQQRVRYDRPKMN